MFLGNGDAYSLTSFDRKIVEVKVMGNIIVDNLQTWYVQFEIDRFSEFGANLYSWIFDKKTIISRSFKLQTQRSLFNKWNIENYDNMTVIRARIRPDVEMEVGDTFSKIAVWDVPNTMIRDDEEISIMFGSIPALTGLLSTIKSMVIRFLSILCFFKYSSLLFSPKMPILT